jgi:hypothetical protein
MTTDKIARTGRVQSWIDDPTSRLPVSCTVFDVQDSMQGKDGIEDSWKFASYALRHGAGVAVHLSKLRPKGSENGKGLTASGPVSFGEIYSTLNSILRRGGHYKNGAVVLHLDANSPDLEEFVTASRQQLPWVKRCVDINEDWWNELPSAKREVLLKGIRNGDVWLNKTKLDKYGNRIFGNVCLEVYLPSRGTCLLQHINLGGCEPNEIPSAFVNGMSELCALHAKTGVGESGEYLPPNTDRQVGLGMLGLANLLRRNGVSYKEFGEALKLVNAKLPYDHTSATVLAEFLEQGILQAANVARYNNMERAFAIAPTASCSYRYQDLDGYTTCPEIAPPIARQVDRDSGTFGVQSYDYGDVEIASEVGWDDYKAVADGIMTMLDATGLLHGYSFNSWSDVVTYNEAFIEEWLASPQTSLYYSLQVMGDVQDKTNAYAALDEDDVTSYLDSLINDLEPQCDCAE